MSALAKRQIELIRRFDDELMYWLDGTCAVMHVGGVGGKLTELRHGREANRPPCVTLEPKRNGQFMLGLVVSRPKNGRYAYDTVLGHWDLSAPIHRGGALNEAKPRHRRIVSWGLQMLQSMLDYGRDVRSGAVTGNDAVMAMPRVLVPFVSGSEKIDLEKHRAYPDAMIDAQTINGKTLVDARIVPDVDVARAIDNDTALEDFTPVSGQRVANPFRHAKGGFQSGGRFVSLSEITASASAELLEAARQFIGRSASSGMTDSDVVSAAAMPQREAILSLFSRIQLLSIEAATELPAPYAGHVLPPVTWRAHKNRASIPATVA